MIINALKDTFLFMFFMSGLLAIAPFAVGFGIPAAALSLEYGAKTFLLVPYGIFVLFVAKQYLANNQPIQA